MNNEEIGEVLERATAEIAKDAKTIRRLRAALKPQLSPAARKLVEETIEAEYAVGDRRVGDALTFLLERQDAARTAITEHD